MRKIMTMIILLGVITLFPTRPVHAYDLYGKITPSEVFSLWLNINKTLLLLSKTPATLQQLEAITPMEFFEKTPGDVLKQIVVFRDKLDQLRQKEGLGKTKIFVDPSGKKVTPSVVFVNSGHVLDSITELLWKIRPDEQGYRANYHYHPIKGKTPSGPFSLADLASRRISVL